MLLAPVADTGLDMVQRLFGIGRKMAFGVIVAGCVSFTAVLFGLLVLAAV